MNLVQDLDHLDLKSSWMFFHIAKDAPTGAGACEPLEPSTPLLGRGRRRGTRAGFGEASWLSQVSTGLKVREVDTGFQLFSKFSNNARTCSKIRGQPWP